MAVPRISLIYRSSLTFTRRKWRVFFCVPDSWNSLTALLVTAVGDQAGPRPVVVARYAQVIRRSPDATLTWRFGC